MEFKSLKELIKIKFDIIWIWLIFANVMLLGLSLESKIENKKNKNLY